MGPNRFFFLSLSLSLRRKYSNPRIAYIQSTGDLLHGQVVSVRVPAYPDKREGGTRVAASNDAHSDQSKDRGVQEGGSAQASANAGCPGKRAGRHQAFSMPPLSTVLQR